MSLTCLTVFPFLVTGPELLFPDDPFRSDWIFLLLLSPVLLYTIITSLGTGQVKQWSRTILSAKYAGTTYKNTSANLPVSIMMGLATLLSFTTFTYFINIEFNIYFWNLKGFTLWLTDLGIISGVYLARIAISAITGEISGNRDLFREYVYSINSFHKFTALFLTAINFMICYLEVLPNKFLIITGLIVTILILLLRLIRLPYIFIRRKSSLFYMILYLCALEITPVLVLIKFISGTF